MASQWDSKSVPHGTFWRTWISPSTGTRVLLMSVWIFFNQLWECHFNQIVFVFNWSWAFHLHLSDIDECKLGERCGPNSHCHNTNGSFYCTCQRDYIPTSGTQHFHPERGVTCKGQYEDRTAHLLEYAQTHTRRHTFTCTTYIQGHSSCFIPFFTFGKGIYYAIHQLKVQSQTFSCFEECWSEKEPYDAILLGVLWSSGFTVTSSSSCWKYEKK